MRDPAGHPTLSHCPCRQYRHYFAPRLLPMSSFLHPPVSLSPPALHTWVLPTSAMLMLPARTAAWRAALPVAGALPPLLAWWEGGREGGREGKREGETGSKGEWDLIESSYAACYSKRSAWSFVPECKGGQGG